MSIREARKKEKKKIGPNRLLHCVIWSVDGGRAQAKYWQTWKTCHSPQAFVAEWFTVCSAVFARKTWSLWGSTLPSTRPSPWHPGLVGMRSQSCRRWWCTPAQSQPTACWSAPPWTPRPATSPGTRCQTCTSSCTAGPWSSAGAPSSHSGRWTWAGKDASSAWGNRWRFLAGSAPPVPEGSTGSSIGCTSWAGPLSRWAAPCCRRRWWWKVCWGRAPACRRGYWPLWLRTSVGPNCFWRGNCFPSPSQTGLQADPPAVGPGAGQAEPGTLVQVGSRAAGPVGAWVEGREVACMVEAQSEVPCSDRWSLERGTRVPRAGWTSPFQDTPWHSLSVKGPKRISKHKVFPHDSGVSHVHLQKKSG